MNPGLALFHSNDFDALLAGLLEQLAPEARARPLRPQQVVVSHPGLGRWLSLRIAEQRGIAANLQFEMPAQFLWRLARENLPDLPAGNPFDPEVLLWHLHALLGEGSPPGPLGRYLDEDPRGIKRYQLARRSAEVYARYALQRPDWLLDWGSDRQPPELRDDPDEPWQRTVFRRLELRMEEAGNAGPGAVLHTLINWIRGVAAGVDSRLPDQAVVFGVSYLPPLYLDFLGALALRRPVDIYFLNPSDAYWEQGVSERTRLRRALRELRAGRAAAEDGLFEVEHPLLAALGRHGATFLQRLLALDLPDPLDAAAEPGYPLGNEPTLLGRLQGSLRDMDPTRMNGAAGDASVQLHACHSPLREVQVLYDRLLVMLAEDPSLRPRDVLVLAPDIQRYAPYVRAVFRRSGDGDDLPGLPFNLSDRRPLDAHPLVAAFTRLLSLPADEFEVDEVLALVEVPAVARRFGLDPRQLARIRDWLAEAGVRWGLDPAHRRSRGGSDEVHNTWTRGLDRMLAGIAVDEPIMVGGRVLPLDRIEGQAAEAVGRLGWLIRHLAELRRAMLGDRTVEQWSSLLSRGIVDGLLAIDQADPDERLALGHVLEAIDTFRRHRGATGSLPWTVVREHLSRLLSEVPGRQAFLSGGVTFANMVPMRSIPARVVCLLGMDHGAFPRRVPAPQFDLLRRHPRIGDRRGEAEDRYLFLECILSARDVLYLSYLGAGENDGEDREPSPLIRELQAFCGADRVPTVRHPMQPFGRKAFDPDSPATHSPQARWMPAARTRGGADRGGTWFQPPDWLPEPATVERVDVQDLVRFFRNPARHYLETQLGLFLRRGETELESDDPVDPDGLARHALRCRLLDRALANGGEMPQGMPDERFRAPGDVAPGEQGMSQVSTLIDELAPYAAWVHDHHGAERPAANPVPVDIRIEAADGSDLRLTGTLDLQRDLQRWQVGRLSAASIGPIMLAQLVACAAGHEVEARCHGFSEKKLHALVLPPLAADRWQPWLGGLLALYRLGLGGPIPFFPKSALVFERARYAGKSLEQALTQARREWADHRGIGEHGDPYYRLLTRGWTQEEIFGSFFQTSAHTVFGPLLALGDGQAWREETLA